MQESPEMRTSSVTYKVDKKKRPDTCLRYQVAFSANSKNVAVVIDETDAEQASQNGSGECQPVPVSQVDHIRIAGELGGRYDHQNCEQSEQGDQGPIFVTGDDLETVARLLDLRGGTGMCNSHDISSRDSDSLD